MLYEKRDRIDSLIEFAKKLSRKRAVEMDYSVFDERKLRKYREDAKTGGVTPRRMKNT